MDDRFKKLTAELILNAKGFYDYGIDQGLISAQDMRLTIEKRQETVKALVNGGMSRRKVAKIVHVSEKQVRKDLGADKVRKSADKVRTGKRPKPEIFEPVNEINAFHQETVGFLHQFTQRFSKWRNANPLIDKDGKAALMEAFYLCADGFARLAQELDGR